MKHFILRLIAPLAFILIFHSGAIAQDIHFSQFYSMPVILNPSLTGHIPGSYRINAIYRNQWSSVTSGGVYSTPGISFDMNFRQKNSNNSFGAGIALANDRSGGGDIRTSLVELSGAYHLSLNKGAKTFLSLGVQGAVLDKRLDVNSILFEDQIDPNTGATIGATTENFEATDFNNFDLRAGATLSGYPTRTFNYMLGFAYMHLLTGNETFLGDSDNALPGRLVFHGQAMIGLDDRFSLRPHLLYMSQTEASELNLGLNFGYRTSEQLSMYVGAGYRNEGAAIFLAGLGYKGATFGFAYDNDISDLNSTGAYEIALGYVGKVFKPVDPILPAIRFY